MLTQMGKTECKLAQTVHSPPPGTAHARSYQSPTSHALFVGHIAEGGYYPSSAARGSQGEGGTFKSGGGGLARGHGVGLLAVGGLLASRHCAFRPSAGPNVLWLCQRSPRMPYGASGILTRQCSNPEATLRPGLSSTPRKQGASRRANRGQSSANRRRWTVKCRRLRANRRRWSVTHCHR